MAVHLSTKAKVELQLQGMQLRATVETLVAAQGTGNAQTLTQFLQTNYIEPTHAGSRLDQRICQKYTHD